MNQSILHYQNKSNINSINESFKGLTEYLVLSKQTRCSCLFSTEIGSNEFTKPQCKKMNSEFPKIIQQYSSNGNSGAKSFHVEKNESNQQHFCPMLNSIVVINKLFYNLQFSIVLGLDNSNQLKISKTISHYDSMFDFVIKSKYFDDVNNNLNLDIKNLIIIIDEFGYLLYLNSKIKDVLAITKEINLINIVDLLENHNDNWMGKVHDVLNYKSFKICDAKMITKEGNLNLRKKIFKGTWGNKPVLFITSLDLHTFDVIRKSSHRQPNAIEIMEKIDSPEPKIKLKVNNDYNLYNINDIIYCKLESNYIEIYMTNKPKITMTNLNLEVSNRLLSQNFFQIHKSHIINLSHVINYTKAKGLVVNLTNSIRLEVSIRRRTKFLEVVENKYL